MVATKLTRVNRSVARCTCFSSSRYRFIGAYDYPSSGPSRASRRHGVQFEPLEHLHIWGHIVSTLASIEPISSLKRAAELVNRVRERREPVYITQNGKGAAVLLDVETYEEQRRAFALLKMCLDGDRAIDEGRSKTLAQLRRARAKRHT